ncbi:SPOR domain-containing protein [Kordiimonas lipolytica]|uniref:SPOR domain-containing protein n=1 Tax=Kordiimonas lipolytica TaxID=1662421 RepID=A0ABV8UB03_9PROT|nr:SPOR domain-containing protein [Kordiimonas lipolytica]
MTQGLSAPVVFPRKGAIVACLALFTSACGGSTNLWQGEDVLVEARQVTLERSVEGVSEDNRDLKDRFNALERLYVDLVKHVRNQDQALASMEQKLAAFQKDPETEAALRRVRNDLSGVRTEIKSLENRLFSVEMIDRNAAYQTKAPAKQQQQQSSQPQATSQPAVDNTQTAPTGTSQTGADVQTGAIDSGTPATNDAQDDSRTYYGAHLASYRSKDQVDSGWSALYRAFSGQLEGLSPRIYTQNQEGIGTFLRLIVGPLEREEDAELLCDNIRAVGGEQYCRVSEYQGEPLK